MHVKADYARTIIKHSPLVNTLDICALISVIASFAQLTPTTSWNGDKPPATLVISHQSAGELSERTQVPLNTSRVTLNHLHMHQLSPLLPIFYAASTVILLLPKATFSPSIQSNLRLPRIRPLLTSTINTLLAIQYSSILSCPNHLNTLYLPTPFLFQLFYAHFIPNSVHSWHCHLT